MPAWNLKVARESKCRHRIAIEPISFNVYVNGLMVRRNDLEGIESEEREGGEPRGKDTKKKGSFV